MKVQTAIFALLLLALATPTFADPISGYVHADGTVVIPSSLYTIQHPKRGNYTIVFTTPLSPSASCVITPVETRGQKKQLGAPYAPFVAHLVESDMQCSFKLLLGNHGGGPYDNDFSFIAVPMSN